jgi:hypothetical protein
LHLLNCFFVVSINDFIHNLYFIFTHISIDCQHIVGMDVHIINFQYSYWTLLNLLAFLEFLLLKYASETCLVRMAKLSFIFSNVLYWYFLIIKESFYFISL